MESNRDHVNEPTTLLLFGPQAFSFNKDSLDRLRGALSDGSASQKWVSDAISGLPHYWDVLGRTNPRIPDSIEGKQALKRLSEFLRQKPPTNKSQETPMDKPQEDVARFPNIVLSPLAVLVQLTDYQVYVETGRIADSGSRADDLQRQMVAQHGLSGKNTIHILGFCIGLLSAFAVASANNGAEFQQNAAVAVRLAMLIGAAGDALEAWKRDRGYGLSRSFATAWRTKEQGELVDRILSSLSPGAYISVRFDETRATITTTDKTTQSLVQQLRAAGITVAEMKLKGYYHSPSPESKEMLQSIIGMCNKADGLQLPDASCLALSTYTNDAGDVQPIRSDAGSLTDTALQAILSKECSWYNIFSNVIRTGSNFDHASILSFGPDRCVPPSFTRCLAPRLSHFADLDATNNRLSDSTTDDKVPKIRKSPSPTEIDMKADAIAVVGMSVKVAGADDLNEFSQMLREGISQHEEVGPERMMLDTLWRENGKNSRQKWYANFIRDPDAFDHKFFKRSPRESSTMDPQQRLFLQAAYQAVEQSGYLTDTTPSISSQDKSHVGVYIGVGAVDYEHNLACHPPNAFTATGNLKSFIAGKTSHHFGWTGPSLTFDTACSSSAVAIHTACRNILSGECTAALAGGITSVSNFLWFQNLAGASFLSPTGQCKPFDDKADGYCRAEGVACVFLKKLSDAITDGDTIHACIASSSVYQNQNCTPLFVPNSPSLSLLFKDVIRKAHLRPADISVVEAHGPGTPVGDPAEYESVMLAFDGSNRPRPLLLGSVKGHIGHTEAASGVISLIKVIMMMREEFIPRQASFSKLSRHIKTSQTDKIKVPTSLLSWKDEFKAALINSYGASGSNASMIVTQATSKHCNDSSSQPQKISFASDIAFPFWTAGLDGRAIIAYCSKLLSFIQARSNGGTAIRDLSFNLNRQSNRTLSHGLIWVSRSISELQDVLSTVACGGVPINASISPVKPERPVIMCFGGQVSSFVGLDRGIYNKVAIFRHHLDECDSTIQSLGLSSILPDIFQRSSIADTVKLQTMLFAMQYACAKSWIDCGIFDKVVAVVGHSFGELTAVCVSGTLTLSDTIKLVAGRAQLIRDAWGNDKGAMLAVEADETTLRQVLANANEVYDGECPANIACFNGPSSFTIAGSTKAVDATAEIIREFQSIRSKRLSVTNAFHSALVDPLRDRLNKIAIDFSFNEPTIPIERATEMRQPHGTKLSPSFVFEHMRYPVYFGHAVQRLAKEHPSAIFLEAGSASTITSMAKRALAEVSAADSSHFQSLSLTNTDKGFDNLTDATVALWKHGLRVSFWPHQAMQVNDYEYLTLPPYQFEKTRHWLAVKSPLTAVSDAAALLLNDRQLIGIQVSDDEDNPLGLWSFSGYGQTTKTTAGKGLCPRFRINTTSDQYTKFVSGHLIAHTAPICPTTLQMSMAIEALFSLHTEWGRSAMQPVMCDLVNYSPLCMDPTCDTWLDFEPLNDSQDLWSWKITSVPINGREGTQTHAQARLRICSSDDVLYNTEFARFERLVNHEQCTALLNPKPDDDLDILQGRNLYRAFAEVVDYPKAYQGIRRAVGLANRCASRVSMKHLGESWMDVTLSDSFSQLGGLWTNCMTDRSPTDIYIATGCEMVMRNPRMAKQSKDEWPHEWHVLAQNHVQSERVYTTDIFVFNSKNGMLAEVMLGIQYARVAKVSMCKILRRLTTDLAFVSNVEPTSRSAFHSRTNIADGPGAGEHHTIQPQQTDIQRRERNTSTKQDGTTAKKNYSTPSDITDDVRNLVSHVSGVEANEITLDCEMADVGIDSLMGMELAREVENVFKRTLDQEVLMEATTLRKFVKCISDALYGSEAHHMSPIQAEDNEEDLSSSENVMWSTSNSNSTGVSTPGNATPGDRLAEAHEKPTAPISGSSQPAKSELHLSRSDVLESFGAVKLQTDHIIRQYDLVGFDQLIIPAFNRLCTALIIEAFEQLGCPLRTMSAGQALPQIRVQPSHQRLKDFACKLLESDARLIDIDVSTGQMTRTSISAPQKSSDAILEEVQLAYPEFTKASELTHYAGTHLAGVLAGRTDGIRVIYGSQRGRELIEAMHLDLSLSCMNYDQMRNVIQRLIARLPRRNGPLKILEMGAGTGGTTRVVVVMLAALDFDVEYTFTDLSPSMVASARRKFGKKYPFMRFAVHDIEKQPIEDLRHQHIILASNAVHATHNLVVSGTHIRSALRPDGFMMILEMTEPMPFVDLIFGLFEGWWLFDDGRQHAIITAEAWEAKLHAAGFGHVDWTDGNLAENKFQKVIMALASGPVQERLPKATGPGIPDNSGSDAERQVSVPMREQETERYLTMHTSNFEAPTASSSLAADQLREGQDAVVLVTGATGSLGSHLAAALAENPAVKTIVCVNRPTSAVAEQRQDEALSNRGIELPAHARAKLCVIETDTTKAQLDLLPKVYEKLVSTVTHIVHNAWPMSGTRPLRGFESQFKTMRNLLDFARDIACLRYGEPGFQVGFQFVSSIGVVGHAGVARVLEERVPIQAALRLGYCEAKWVCERMIDETLHRYPRHFRAMVVRPGQISGSRTSGFWNPIEHFAFLVKSSQSLRAWPDLDGVLQWVPVNDAAGCMMDLLRVDELRNAQAASPFYHIDNPVGQSWKHMSTVLSEALNIPQEKFVPFRQWIRLVRQSPLPAETYNPAARLIDFLDEGFERMSCGGLILDTSKATEHSPTLARLGPVSVDVAKMYVSSWKRTGWLQT